MKKTIQLIAVSLALCSTSQAASYNLGSLISSNGSISIGDKIFADFGFSSSSFDPNNATVTPSVDAFGVYTLTFQGPWVSINNPAGNSLAFSYTVEATGPGMHIASIGQSFVLSAGGTSGSVSVVESVTDGPAGPLLAKSTTAFVPSSVLDLEDPAPEAGQGDQLAVNPLSTKVNVSTVVTMSSNIRGAVGATTIAQHFTQVSVPETGATVSLLGASLFGIGLIRRKVAQR